MPLTPDARKLLECSKPRVSEAMYPEGEMEGLVLRQEVRKKPVDTTRVQLVELRAVPKRRIKQPADVVGLVREMEDYDREYAKVIDLDTRNQVVGIENISIGSLTATIIHPREAVKGAILKNSASVIFVHNHPSGDCTPSKGDHEVARKLKDAFDLVGINLLDSIIIGKGSYYSFRDGELKSIEGG